MTTSRSGFRETLIDDGLMDERSQVMQQAAAPAQDAATPSQQRSRPFPASGPRTIALSVIALLAGIGAAVGLETIRYERLVGTLQAGLRTVTVGRDARIDQILVEPGEVVVSGQPLLVLSNERLLEQVHRQSQEVAALEAEVAHSEARMLLEIEWRKKNLDAEIFETKLKSAQYLKQQFENQMENIAWQSTLQELDQSSANAKNEGIPSLIFEGRQGDDRRTSALLRKEAANNAQEVSLAQVELCDERLKQLEKMLRDLPDRVRRSMGVNLVERRLQAAREQRAALDQRQQALTLTSDGPGLVGVFQKQPGDRVSAHEPIVQLIDEEQPFVLAPIPSGRVSSFPVGTVVELRFAGGKRGHGRIDRIPPQASVDESAVEPVVSVHVSPVGALWPKIPFGSAVEVRRKK